MLSSSSFFFLSFILFFFGQAYPGRIPFLEFFERFELLQRQLVQASVAGQETSALPPPAHATEAEAKQGCRSILEAFLPSKFFQIGHTRVGGEGRGGEFFGVVFVAVVSQLVGEVYGCP